MLDRSLEFYISCLSTELCCSILRYLITNKVNWPMDWLVCWLIHWLIDWFSNMIHNLVYAFPNPPLSDTVFSKTNPLRLRLLSGTEVWSMLRCTYHFLTAEGTKDLRKGLTGFQVFGKAQACACMSVFCVFVSTRVVRAFMWVYGRPVPGPCFVNCWYSGVPLSSKSSVFYPVAIYYNFKHKCSI